MDVELKVTPDKYLPHRYAGASGDFNPIHIDPEFAKQVGLPSNILHGLYSMAQVARASTAGGRRRPAHAEAAVGPVPRHGLPRAGDHRDRLREERARRRVVVDIVAEQGGNQIIRNAEAELAADAPRIARRAWRSPPARASSCARSSRRTWSSTSPSARSGSPSRTTCPGGRRRSAPSWPASRRPACSSTRTPPPGACRPTAATASTSTSCSARASCRCRASRVELTDDAPRGRRGHARHHRAALAGHEPARAGHRAADRDGHDPPRRGAAAPAAGGDGGRDHLHRRRHQARDLLRRARRPGPRRLGGQLPERGARRHGRRLAHAARPSSPTPRSRRASAPSSPRSPRPSPSSRRRPRAPCSWRAPRGCCPSTASRSCRSSPT